MEGYKTADLVMPNIYFFYKIKLQRPKFCIAYHLYLFFTFYFKFYCLICWYHILLSLLFIYLFSLFCSFVIVTHNHKNATTRTYIFTPDWGTRFVGIVSFQTILMIFCFSALFRLKNKLHIVRNYDWRSTQWKLYDFPWLFTHTYSMQRHSQLAFIPANKNTIHNTEVDHMAGWAVACCV